VTAVNLGRWISRDTMAVDLSFKAKVANATV
jgi:hypothetical protein